MPESQKQGATKGIIRQDIDEELFRKASEVRAQQGAPRRQLWGDITP